MVGSARLLLRPTVVTSVRRALSDRTECPLCQRLGRGPCGDIFWKWWECTERNPENYATACEVDFRQLQQCLERESKYYDDSKNGLDQGELPQRTLRSAWQELIEDDLRDTPRSSFPNGYSPQRKGSRGISIHSIVPNDGRLVLAYVTTFPSGKLIAAAALSDMVSLKDGYMLFAFSDIPDPIKVCAVYEAESEQLTVCEEVILDCRR